MTTRAPPESEAGEVTARLTRNMADEILTFLIGNVEDATSGIPVTDPIWYPRLSEFHAEAKSALERLGAGMSDTVQGCNSIEIMNFRQKTGGKTGPSSGTVSVLGH